METATAKLTRQSPTIRAYYEGQKQTKAELAQVEDFLGLEPGQLAYIDDAPISAWVDGGAW